MRILLLGNFRHKNETDDEQHGNAEHSDRGIARNLGKHAHEQRAEHRCVLTENIEEAIVFVGMFLRNELAKLAARKGLDAALEQTDAHGKHPELHSGAQEKRREQRDAEIRENRDEQHALRAEFARQAAIRDSRGERHELRDQQRKHELG